MNNKKKSSNRSRGVAIALLVILVAAAVVFVLSRRGDDGLGIRWEEGKRYVFAVDYSTSSGATVLVGAAASAKEQLFTTEVGYVMDMVVDCLKAEEGRYLL